jgi:hypothetical protein
MLTGVFFWIIRLRYFTFFWLQEYPILNVVSFHIVGTVLILIGLFIIQRVYPFPHTIFGIILAVIILAVNVLDFFLYNNELYQDIHQFYLVALSLVLLVITKLIETGLRYFGNDELSRKWHNLLYILFFGFTIPLYGIALLTVCDLFHTEKFTLSLQLILIAIPLAVTLLIFFTYYLVILVRSFNFLLRVQENDLLP